MHLMALGLAVKEKSLFLCTDSNRHSYNSFFSTQSIIKCDLSDIKTNSIYIGIREGKAAL